MMVKRIRLMFFLLFTLMIFSSFQTERENIWLSNIPPKSRKKDIRPFGMHHLSSLRGKRGVVNIHQWVRVGDSVHGSSYASPHNSDDFQVLLFSPSGKKVKTRLDTTGNVLALSYESEEEGFYNGYLIDRKLVNDTLFVSVAKAEMLNHSCRNGHKDVLRKIPPGSFPDLVQAEIIRERVRYEDFHFFISSGDEITFQVLLRGEPAEHVQLRLITEKGWQQIQKTDKEGRASFQFIQDYFSMWQELDNRKEFYYVLFADKTIKQAGVYQEQPYNYIHYRTSISDAYRPSRTMYSSMVWALVVFLLVIILTATGIYFYRNSKKRSFKEIVFDEKN